MYWYYKYPLLLIVILMLSGMCVFIWRTCLAPYFTGDSPEEAGSVPVVTVVEPGTEVPAGNTTPESPAIAGDLSNLLVKAKQEFQSEQLKAARNTAREGMAQCSEFSAEWLEFAAVADAANKMFMNGTAPCQEKKRYVIQSGDKLLKIAYKLGTTVEALQKQNALSTTSSLIYPGQTLVYIDGTWSIKISKSRFLLCLYLDGEFYRIYKISTGRHDRTPAGNFIVDQKLMNPTWTYAGEVIPFGDKRNVLGTRWIGLKAIDEENLALTGYGIHGTMEPEKIGQPASLGCIRMLNEEVEDLYDCIPNAFKEKNIIVTIVE